MDTDLLAVAKAVQLNEITEYYVYTGLAKLCKDEHNA